MQILRKKSLSMRRKNCQNVFLSKQPHTSRPLVLSREKTLIAPPLCGLCNRRRKSRKSSHTCR